MSNQDQEYREIFYTEALDNHEELNRLFTELEKNHSNKKAIEEIFRIAHTLKGNAQGMGFEKISSFAHTMEDIFGEIRNNRLDINEKLFNDLFKANDVLGKLIAQVKNPDKKVSFRGIKTKLEVFLKNARAENQPAGDKEDQKQNEGGQEVQEENVNEANVSDQSDNTGENNKNDEPLTAETASEHAPSSGGSSSELQSTESEEVLVAEEEEEEKQEDNDQEIVFSDTIQVPVQKLDNLMNLVGELLIERDRIIAVSSEKDQGLSNEFSMLQRITSELQYSVMDARLVQTGFLFNKFHRIVRDAANVENKKVNLVLEGTQQEIDRNILQIISDSLIHLVRNAIGHGLEKEEERKRKNKPAQGTVTLKAKNEKDNVIIEVKDDGKGMDSDAIKQKAIEKGLAEESFINQMNEQEVLMFIFEPGFSSAEKISSISGRGVGMDVVKRAMDSIGGKINIDTEIDKGSTISLELPSTMAVKGALLFQVGNTELAIPLSFTESVEFINTDNIHQVSTGLVTYYGNKTISLIFLSDLFDLPLNQEHDAINKGAFLKTFSQTEHNKDLNVIIISYNNKYIGIVVDKLLQQKEIVEKTLKKPLDKVPFVSGVTILGNGNVCLVLDAAAITGFLFKSVKTIK